MSCLSVDTRKLLNWINQSDNLNDYATISLQIMNDNVAERTVRFPQIREATFLDTSENRRKYLGKGIVGLIKAWDSELARPVLMIYEPRKKHRLDIEPPNHYDSVSELKVGLDESWSKLDYASNKTSAHAYWVIGKSGGIPTHLEWIAIIPRRGSVTSPAVSWLQPIFRRESSLDELSIEPSVVNQHDELQSWLKNIDNPSNRGNLGVYHVARIIVRPSETKK